MIPPLALRHAVRANSAGGPTASRRPSAPNAPDEPHEGVRHEERREETVHREQGVEPPLQADAGRGRLPLQESNKLLLEFGTLLAEELADEEGEGLLVGGGVPGGAEEAGVGALEAVLRRAARRGTCEWAPCEGWACGIFGRGTNPHGEAVDKDRDLQGNGENRGECVLQTDLEGKSLKRWATEHSPAAATNRTICRHELLRPDPPEGGTPPAFVTWDRQQANHALSTHDEGKRSPCKSASTSRSDTRSDLYTRTNPTETERSSFLMYRFGVATLRGLISDFRYVLTQHPTLRTLPW